MSPTTLSLVSVAATISSALPLGLDALGGEYVVKHQSGNMQDRRLYTVEDRLLIVKNGPDSVYFSVETTGGNGHMCSMSGIAAVSGDHLHFYGSAAKAVLGMELSAADSPEDFCEMKLRPVKGGIIVEDVDRSCGRRVCGTRAFLGSDSDAPDFLYRQRRPVRNLREIMKSDEYRNAVEIQRQASAFNR